MGELRSSEFNEDVLRFLRVSGATQNMETVIDAMLAQQGDELPQEILEGFRQKWMDNMDDITCLNCLLFTESISHRVKSKSLSGYMNPL